MSRPFCSRALACLIFSLLCACSPSPPVSSSPSPTASGKVTPSAEAGSDRRRTLVALGDSLTEGLGVEDAQTYPAQLERRLQAEGLDWTVVNAGYSGETSSGARSRLNWVLKLKPDAVLLETGGNDGLRGIPPEVTRENLHFLVNELKSRQIPVMLAGMKTLANLGPDYTNPFEAVYTEVAQEQQVPLIPFFLEGVAGSVELNQPDRIHPTEEGYAKVVEHIAPTVIDWLRGLPPR
jgi:acyl-CoA thioesterase-1